MHRYPWLPGAFPVLSTLAVAAAGDARGVADAATALVSEWPEAARAGTRAVEGDLAPQLLSAR